jgi:cytochrome c oxidase subunit 2
MTIFSFLGLKLAACDAAEPWQLDFQEPATPIMEGIINLHNDIMFFLVVILVFVSTMFYALVVEFTKPKGKFYYVPMTHHSLLEFVWTLIPALILVAIAIPSFALIYSMDDLISAEFTLKVIGHQWYWSYEYGDLTEDPSLPFSESNRSLGFDSYMVAEDDLPLGAFRLLEVDQRVYLPIHTHIRILVTSADVLHSWAVPSLGVKMDACPGRLNQIATYITRPGVFYGQCSEICGINHAFMPIVVEAF